MTELEPVTGRQNLLVTPQDIRDSEFGGLLVKRKGISSDFMTDTQLNKWIKRAAARVRFFTGRDTDYLVSDPDIFTMANETVILITGIIVLNKAQIARFQVTEVGYRQLVQDTKETVRNNI